MRSALSAFVALAIGAAECATTFAAIPVSSCDNLPLDRAGEKYVLQADCVSSTSAFVIQADNVTLDLNGHTVTYQAGLYDKVPNGDFESCTGGVPASWDLSAAPRARCAPRTTFWGNQELVLDFAGPGSQTLRSAPFQLPANKTMAAFTWVKSPNTSGWSQRTEIWDSNGTPNDLSDDSLLSKCRRGEAEFSHSCNFAYDDAYVGRGFASIGDEAMEYKNSTARLAYLKVVVTLRDASRLAGGAVFVDGVSVVPSRDVGIACDDYQHEIRWPDLPTPPRSCGKVTITDSKGGGKIASGGSYGYMSPAVFLLSFSQVTLTRFSVETNGVQTSAVDLLYAGGAINIDSLQVRTNGFASTNRMYPVAQIRVGRGTGPISILNSRLSGPPQSSVVIGRSAPELQPQDKVILMNNVLQNDERVTEGYAIGLGGIKNVEIRHNSVFPVRGRCLMMDNSGQNASISDVLIHHNDFKWTEQRNPEYDEHALMAACIRIRQFEDDPDTHRNIRIFSNRFAGRIGPGDVNKVFGIVPDLYDTGSEVRIYGNHIQTVVDDPGSERYGAPLAIQRAARGCGLEIYDNTLESNAYHVKWSDSDNLGTAGVRLARNLFVKEPTRWGGASHTTNIGYSSSDDVDHEYLGAIYRAGTSGDDIISGGSGKGRGSLSQMWYLVVTVVDSAGIPIHGATVQATDRNGVVRGTADSNVAGRVEFAVPEWRWSSIASGQKDMQTPYSVTAMFEGNSATASGVSVTGNTSVSVGLQVAVGAAALRRCGDDVMSQGEACDGADLGNRNCQTEGFTRGVLQCAVDCARYDLSDCDSAVGANLEMPVGPPRTPGNARRSDRE